MLFVDSEKYNYDQQKNLFITQRISHLDIFGSMFQLKNRENAKAEIEDLKKNVESLRQFQLRRSDNIMSILEELSKKSQKQRVL